MNKGKWVALAGGLGNQLFQFAFLNDKIKKNKLLITTNFHQLIKISNIDKNINFMNNLKLNNIIYTIIIKYRIITVNYIKK